MVGHFVGYTANAAIGVSWQIFLVVIVFIASLFTGMGVLVARFAGANDHERVDRTVYQAFLVAVILAVGIMAPVGYFASPALLRLVNATPEVSAHALPYLRTMFLFSIGMLLFFMLGGALRAAGDARTPLRLGVCMTGAQPRAEHRPHQGVGTDSGAGDVRIRARYGHREQHRFGRGVVDDPVRPHGDPFPPPHVVGARLDDHSPVVQVRPARGAAGRGDERRRA